LKKVTLYHDQYVLEEKIGGGGYATIYRARENDEDEPRAIKVAQTSSDPGVGKSIRMEARYLSELEHKSIVKVIPLNRANAHPVYSARAIEMNGRPDFFVMEYLQGGTLNKLLEESGPLPPPEALAIALEIARALYHMHAEKLTHNDLKLENIVMRRPVCVGEPYTPVLIDLGVAARILPPPALSAYITPPEQVRYNKMEIAPELEEEIDRKKVDVWGLGIVLYRMLGGKLPFTGNEKILTQRILYERPTALTRLSSVVTTELEELVIDGCLAKDPGDRLSMLDLGRSLASHEHNIIASRDILLNGKGRFSLLGRNKR
jgi:serine/threonine-protein kinase